VESPPRVENATAHPLGVVAWIPEDSKAMAPTARRLTSRGGSTCLWAVAGDQEGRRFEGC